mgnify:CR=1 FL=1
MSREVDVAIIGAGSAGLFALSQVRRKTDNYVLIDGGELGTTCARVGCMPSKVMIQVADDYHRRSIFDREGIDGAEELGLDVPAVMEHVQDLRDVFVDKTLGVTDALDQEHLIDGYARFVDDHTVEVNGEQIRAKSIVIATGTIPVVPDDWQAFREDIITTEELFELEDLPGSVAVIGLGSIGLEIGQALSRLGVEVTGVDLLENVAKLDDPGEGDHGFFVVVLTHIDDAEIAPGATELRVLVHGDLVRCVDGEAQLRPVADQPYLVPSAELASRQVKPGGVIVLAPVAMSLIRIEDYSTNLWGRDIRTLYNVNRRDAEELLQCLWIKFANQPAPPKTGVTAQESGTYTDFANINIAGLLADGSDGSSEVSHLLLRDRFAVYVELNDLTVLDAGVHLFSIFF